MQRVRQRVVFKIGWLIRQVVVCEFQCSRRVVTLPPWRNCRCSCYTITASHDPTDSGQHGWECRAHGFIGIRKSHSSYQRSGDMIHSNRGYLQDLYLRSKN